MAQMRGVDVRPLAYLLLNLFSASLIVFANKYVLSNSGFHFSYALSWIHTIFTWLGMSLFCKLGLFEAKRIPLAANLQLAAAYVGYIALGTLSLQLNNVGFYQVMKIAVAPTVILLELLIFRRLPRPRVVASVLVVCMGIAVATVSDTQVASNLLGIFVGLAATVMTALYQIWAGSLQKELHATSFQLLYAYTPFAALILMVLVPILEPLGWHSSHRTPDTLFGFQYTSRATLAILVSSLLGLLVSLSTFLVIGATSSLTYNVVGHIKTLVILTGGCLFFNDTMPPKKLAGVGIAMAGIVWYTQLKLQPQQTTKGKAKGQMSSPLLGDVESACKQLDKDGWIVLKGSRRAIRS